MDAHHPRRAAFRGHGYFKRLGPGIVTGAADDDPSGIGTYSQVGAAQGLSYGGSSAFEWRAGAEFVKLAPLFVEIGWQEKRFDIDVDDYALDATLAGAVARAGFLFR